MKIARVAAAGGQAKWGVVDGDQLRYLPGSPYQDLIPTNERVSLDSVQLLAPVDPRKIVVLGKNYAAHRSEMGFEATERPSIFFKPHTTISDPGADVILPPRSMSTNVEHETELAVVIGKPARNVTEADALDYALGYTIADDVSARDLQLSDPHPTRGKGFDTFCPIGPWIETDLDIDTGVAIRGSVNGELRHDGHTTQMTYGVRFIISYLSAFMTLVPGDVILTGSPGGTGPLNPGDHVVIEIPGIGVLEHGVAASHLD
jgi:2-keto-4-pentenoate hydratase/2-oxohepta-3-ene-1,7-dioic acid hydratase in catechol pathway